MVIWTICKDYQEGMFSIMNNTSSIRLAAGVLLCATALSGCVVAPYPYAGYQGGGPGNEVVIEANTGPPPPYAEVVPVMPFAGAIWINGYWGWSGRQHHWIAGNWVQPRPGYRWQPHQWQRGQGGNWFLHGGHWRR